MEVDTAIQNQQNDVPVRANTPEPIKSAIINAETNDVTTMETSECDINKELNEAPPENGSLNNGTSEKPEDDIISIESERDEILSQQTKKFSQRTDTSLDSTQIVLSSQEEGLIRSEKSGEIKLHVSSEEEKTVVNLEQDEEVPNDTDVESTLIAVAAEDEMAHKGEANVDTEDVFSVSEGDMTASQAEKIYEKCVQEELDNSKKDETNEEEIKEVTVKEETVEEQKPRPVESEPIDIVELDDSDEDDAQDENGSEAEEYDEEYSEEGDYDDEEDIEMVEQESSSAKNQFSDYEVPQSTSKKIAPHYKSSDLHRIFVQQMKRRSVKMLNCRRYSQKRGRMQIMDDAGEAIECETTIPNNAGSPDVVKPQKVIETQNEEKENTDPLDSNNVSDSLFSSEESKENVESESKSCDDEENEENHSKNDDSIQMIDSDDESGLETNEINSVNNKNNNKESETDVVEKEVNDTKSIKPKENDTDAKKVLLEDLGSDEAADAKRTPEINEENLYDDIENELEPHVVNFSVSVDQNAKKQQPKNEAMDVSGISPDKTTEETKVTKVDASTTKEVTIKKEIREEFQTKETTETTSKRRRSPSPIPSSNNHHQPAIQPSKKLRLELENSYERHDKLLREYIEATSGSKTVEDLKQGISVLETDIKSLDAMLRAKEDEWNNILHMKLVKEEIRMRLVRRKETLEMKLTDPTTILDQTNTNTGFQSSTPLPNKSQSQQLSTAFNAPLLQESLKSGRHSSSTQNLTQSVSMMPFTSNTSSATQSILQQRANMKGADLVKEKQNAAKIQRNILPRPTTLPNHEQILRNLAMSSATSAAFQQQQLNELFNGHSKISMGRQGPTKDVSSIIADFREKNPDVPPRRGRRVKGSSVDLNSRPSSADSSHSNSNAPSAMSSNAPFKEILAKFAKMTPAERQLYGSNNSIISALNMTTQAAAQGGASLSSNNKPPPYPEVTLHPVMNANDNGSSLLHGILTKTSSRSSANTQSASAATAAAANFTNYSPTLARLLTSPERISSQNLPNYTQASNNSLAGLTASGLNLSNKNSEITITPVINSQSLQQTLLAQQQKFQIEDDNDDNSTDRLVIDEGDNQQSSVLGRSAADETRDNEVPQCQGCRRQEAQFVCAGCGNQWYCSRECQVQAWDEHSENCSG